jgi:5-methyltetrahydropteroyltriglutamate--homocysteine methyltransferase
VSGEPLFPTTLVGSYPQPEWLIDRKKLAGRFPPRVRAKELWRIPEPFLAEAQDDATIMAIKAQEEAGLDIVTDGEIRRESYSNRFATALEGIDLAKPGHVKARSGHRTPVPRVVGRIRRTGPVEVRDMKFLRANTDRVAKITLPGPFTMSQQAINEHYDDPDEMVMDYAVAVNAEARDLVKAGADIIQLDEPWLRQDPQAAKRIAVKAINRALQGITVPTIVHLCFGYAALVPGETKPVGYSFLPELADSTADQISIEAAQPKLDLGVLKDLAPRKILLGVLDLGDPKVETPKKVADRIRRGLKHLPAERLIPAPDCGMKYLPREVAFGKLSALAEGAAMVRAELG